MAYALGMREPDLQIDGWCIESGEAQHAAHPDTFWIPDRLDREKLGPGDLVKLIFNFIDADPAEPVAAERMWVLIRKKTPRGYLGVLDNFPWSEPANGWFADGMELPFAARHIIEISAKNDNSIKAAQREPMIRWQEQVFDNMLEKRRAHLRGLILAPLSPTHTA